MKALLEKLELMDELDPLAKNWRDHVREMSYDMENCIDDFMRDLEGTDAKKGFIKKTAKRLKMLRKRHRIAQRMEEVKVLALEANERRMRYLVVIDDLWDQSAWNIMSCIFPEVTNASKVIVTTRVDDVAIWACHGDRECLKAVSAEILKKCGGLPLAIITIASLLASRQARSRDEWESIRNSLGAKFATTPTLKEMRIILNLSYMHLPLHLRPCLLYLGMYLEDHEILMRDLVLQWVAEGFVSNTHGSNMVDVAKIYFNELINRSMVQPEKSMGDEAVVSCKVHDMMLDLIVSKCAEENFSSVAHNWEDVARMHGFEHKVRRLSLNPRSNDVSPRVIHTSMSHVRSFSQFGESKFAPPLSLFKYLRVLVYEFSYKKGTTLDLTPIGQLFQLRYLKTLQIASRSAQNFPSDIVLLPRLSQLTLPKGIGLPQGIKSIKSLRDLNCFDIGKSSLEDIDGLGKLTNLRVLVFLGKMMVEVVDALVSSIGKLCDLKLLIVHGEPSKHYCDLIYSLSNPPLHIEKIYLRGWLLKRIPNWIGDLHCLGSLSLSVEHLSTEEVNVVGKLPSLVELCLWVTHITEDSGAAIACTGLFPILEDLRLFSEDGDDATICMEFKAGVMPNLRLLGLEICDRWSGATPLGMEHLLALEHIRIGGRSSIHKRRDVLTAFRTAADVHQKALPLLCSLDRHSL
ncbi:disease resistance protein RGA5-like [Aegilops tauschii subsp. strangulata]|uniref:disease resistance protein RGA5-like n=1 Tax=Aegilops tauschii subsp. strangulata TaxID=200361 RepID=UPI003CC85250